MFHMNSSYEAQKIWEYRQFELNRQTRAGIYFKDVTTEQREAFKHRGLWHRWFGSRRLGTSMK